MFAVKLLNGWEPNDLEQIQCLLGCFPVGSEFEVWMALRCKNAAVAYLLPKS